MYKKAEFDADLESVEKRAHTKNVRPKTLCIIRETARGSAIKSK
jgi:hypothetical protein